MTAEDARRARNDVPVEVAADVAARRGDVLRRLLERGVPAGALRTLLPGWDDVITSATAACAQRSLGRVS
ncbi:MAG TPA: hypothetical protein VHF25_10425 [Nitriliruptorales bacterium]|nr:hypothetical protein [Nitriliruptorales bacterium]